MDEDFQILPTPKAYATPEQTAQARKLAQILMGGSKQSKTLTHPLEVLGNLANTTLGVHQFNEANRLDRTSDLFDARQFVEGTKKPPIPAEVPPEMAASMPATGGGGPASVRNNNPGAQWPGPVASQFGATGAQDLSGGNKIAAFDSPVKGGAAHFALLAQKYSGMPLESAIEKWSGGNNSTPYTQFVARRAGLRPDTPITPELLRSPQGIQLAKAMADWEAGGSYPMTEKQWGQAHSMAFGGQAGQSQGMGEGVEGQALGFAGVPDEGGSGDNAMGGIISALQAPKLGTQPVPGSPVTQTLPAGAQSQTGNILPSSVVPQRMQMSGEGLINTLASTRLDPSVKQAALQIYMEQNQPMQLKIPGGTLLIGQDGSQVPVPELYQKELKAGDTTVPVGISYDWNPKGGITQRYAPTGSGGQGPLGTPPPSANAQNPNSVIPPQLREATDFSQEQYKRKQLADEDTKNLFKKFEETTQTGIQAQKNMPQLQQLRQMIEDPALAQHIGSDFSLDINRIKALFGDKAAERAAALMQAFDKGAAGQIISDLKTQFGGLGQIRVAEIKLAEKAFASRYNTREANRKILDLSIRANQQLAGLNEAAQEYMAAHPNDATSVGLNQHKIAWLKANPMMTPEEIKEYNKTFEEDAKYPAPKKAGKNAPKAVTPAVPASPVWGGGGNTLPQGWTRE